MNRSSEKPAKRATLSDVAKAANVSTAVVSYVLNNGPRNVSQASRERVQKAIADLNYRRNTLASALVGGKTNLIGLLVPDASNAFFGEMAREFEREAQSRGYLTMLGNTSNDPAVEGKFVDALSGLHARGVFVTTVNGAEHEDLSCPRVYVHSAPAGAQSPQVLFDDHGGGEIATRHLIEQGYEDIHCLAGATDFGPLGNRRQGWETEMAKAKLPTADRVHYISANRLEATQKIRDILSSDGAPRAIFATTDEQAIATVRAAHEVGLRIPQDLAIVGFDGISEARLGSLRITTIVLPLREFAKKAFDTLDDTPAADRDDVLLSGELLIGETCGGAASLA